MIITALHNRPALTTHEFQLLTCTVKVFINLFHPLNAVKNWSHNLQDICDLFFWASNDELRVITIWGKVGG